MEPRTLKGLKRRDYLVIRYKIKPLVGNVDEYFLYQLVTAKKTKNKRAAEKNMEYLANFTDLSRAEAHDIIDTYNLTPAVVNEYGTIYDSGNFQKKYKGRIWYDGPITL